MQQRIDSRRQQPQLLHPAFAFDDETNVQGRRQRSCMALRGIRQLPTEADGLQIHTYKITLLMLFGSETVR